MTDAAPMTVAEVRERVRGGGLPAEGSNVVAMLSGGRDSVCLLDVVVALCGAERVRALHVNYGLRADSDGDEAHCRGLCERLGVEIEVVAQARGGARSATCTRGRASCATGRRRGGALAARARARGDRPHRHRPGRDDPLPARRLAGTSRAAGHARERGAACAAVAGADTRSDRRLLPGAESRVARGREQRQRGVRTRAGSTWAR